MKDIYLLCVLNNCKSGWYLHGYQDGWKIHFLPRHRAAVIA